MVRGWRQWFWDGSSAEGRTWDDCVRVAEEHPDDVLLRLIYYEDDTKQIQQGQEWYYAAIHPCGEIVFGTEPQKIERSDIERRYPGCVIQRGKWAPDAFYRRLCEEAYGQDAPEPCEGCD